MVLAAIVQAEKEKTPNFLLVKHTIKHVVNFEYPSAHDNPSATAKHFRSEQ